MTMPQPASGAFRERRHHLPVRVYWAETDLGGVMHHANYVIYMERGRSEFLRCLELDQASLARDRIAEGLIWVIRRIEVDYLRSARLDDVLNVETWIGCLKGASMEMHQRILRGEETLMTAKVVAAFTDSAGRPARIPSSFRERLDAAGVLPEENRV